jgi:hypothetical protein
MKTPLTCCLFSLVILTCAALPQRGSAQHLYNKERDDQAQDAVKKSADVLSGALFQKQLDNDAVLNARQIERLFLDNQRVQRAMVRSFNRWSGLKANVTAHVGLSIPPPAKETKDQLAAELAALQTKKAAATRALDDLKKEIKAATDDEVALPGTAGDLQPILDLASLLTHSDVESATPAIGATGTTPDSAKHTRAVAALGKSLEALQDVYEGYQQKMKEIGELKGRLLELRKPLAELALERLVLDEGHVKRQAEIVARREADLEDLRFIRDEFNNALDPKQNVLAPEDLERSVQDVFSEAVADAQAARAAYQPVEMDLQAKRQAIRKADASIRTLQASLTTQTNILARPDAKDGEVKAAQAEILKIRAELADTQTGLDKARMDQAKLVAAAKEGEAGYKRAYSRVRALGLILYDATALVAHAKMPDQLYQIRLVQEESRYSIEKSAKIARARELTVSTGVQRLALYHKGGLKPTDVAQFVHALAAVAIPPSILAK